MSHRNEPSTLDQLSATLHGLGRALGRFWQTIAKTSFFYAFIVTPLSILWWWYAARLGPTPLHLLAAVSLACFMMGAILGFVFTTYGEEAGTVGKIRDWVIGGLTGATLVQAAQGGGVFKNFLLKFVNGSDPNGNQLGMVMSMAIVYTTLGFLFMFFQRELVWNPHLAEARKERIILEGSGQATTIVQKLVGLLPPDVLTGIQDISAVDVSSKVKAELQSALFDSDVETFLKQAEDALKSGQQLGWEDVYKVANIQYYRAYFELGDQHPPQVKKALQWITRALAFNPLHADLTMKYADMLGDDNQRDAAVALLESLVIRPEAPAVAFEWLGYYLRTNPARLDDSIRYSEKFMALFPGDNDTKFNLAYAYGAKYCQELQMFGEKHDRNSESRARSLYLLREALAQYPKFKETIATDWLKEGELFRCMRGDPDFDKLVPEHRERKDA